MQFLQCLSILFSFILKFIDLHANDGNLFLALHGSGIHFVECLLDLNPIGIVFLLKIVNALFTLVPDITDHPASFVLQRLMILGNSLMAVSPNFIELRLHIVPIQLQFVINHRIDEFDCAL